MSQTLIGYFNQSSDAREAVAQLLKNGVSKDRIELMLHNGNGQSRRVENDYEDNPVAGFFKSVFRANKQEEDHYPDRSEPSTSMVTVKALTAEDSRLCATIMESCGAINLEEKVHQKSAPLPQEAFQPVSRPDYVPKPSSPETSLQQQEEIRRSRSRIIEKPVDEHMRLREGPVNIERKQVDRPLSDQESSPFQERVFELIERAEIPVIGKEARVVEEVRVSKSLEERDAIVRETLKRTEVDVERSPNKENDLQSRDDLRRE